MRRTVRPGLVVVIAVAAFHCTGDRTPSEPEQPAPLPPAPGVFTLVLRSPDAAEGAAVIDVSAANVTGATADSAWVIAVPDGERMRIVIVRGQPGTLRAMVAVSDTTAWLDPRVVEVAGADNALRASLAAYSVEVQR